MFNRSLFVHIFILILLVFFQYFVFIQFNIIDKYNPFVFIIWIIFYPTYRNDYLFLVLSFLLGFSLDLLMGTGGLNAFSCVVIASLRKYIVRMLQGTESEFNTFSWQEFNFIQVLIYVSTMAFLYNFVLVHLEYFKLNSHFFYKSYFALINSLITTIFVVILYYLFQNKISE